MFPLDFCDFPPGLPLKSLGKLGLPSSAIQHFSGHVFVVFSLHLMCTISLHCFLVQSSQWQQWWDFKEQVVLSFHCPIPCWTWILNMDPELIYGCCDHDHWFVILYVFVCGTWFVFFILSPGRWTAWFDRVYLDVCYFHHKVWLSALTKNVGRSPRVKGLFLSPSLAWVEEGPCVQVHV